MNFILFYLPVEQIPKAVAKYFDGDEAQVNYMIKVSTCFAKFGTKTTKSNGLSPSSPIIARKTICAPA